MKVVVASANPVKLEAVKVAFSQCFDDDFVFEGVSVPSGVSDQPVGSDETRQGALNRVQNAQKAMPDADFYVGLEGGVEWLGDELMVFAWMVVRSGEKEGLARTGSFSLPPKIVSLIHEGYELGIADDMVFRRENSKQKNGAVGILTNDLVTRQSYYEQALILALIPFLNKELYGE